MLDRRTCSMGTRAGIVKKPLIFPPFVTSDFSATGRIHSDSACFSGGNPVDLWSEFVAEEQSENPIQTEPREPQITVVYGRKKAENPPNDVAK